MRSPISSLVVIFVCACAGASITSISGCIVETRSNPPPPEPSPATVDGTLTIDWTIDGRTDPNQCNQAVSTSIEITIFSSSGSAVGTYQQACASFATSITLPAGTYTANALLIDSAGNARTTTIAVNPFTLRGNDTLNVPIDFPASS